MCVFVALVAVRLLIGLFYCRVVLFFSCTLKNTQDRNNERNTKFRFVISRDKQHQKINVWQLAFECMVKVCSFVLKGYFPVNWSELK